MFPSYDCDYHAGGTLSLQCANTTCIRNFEVKISVKVANLRKMREHSTMLDLRKESHVYGKWMELVDDPVSWRLLLLVMFNIGVLLPECQ